MLLRSAEIFSPEAGKSVPVRHAKGCPDSTRFAHCSGVICRLKDGTVLLAGGEDGGDRDSGAELFNPKTGTFSLLDPSPLPSGASCVSLAGGRVLIFGGKYHAGKEQGFSSQVLAYDPAARAFTRGGTLRAARYGHATVLLQDGKVLVAGGLIGGNGPEATEATARSEVFDPETGTSEEVGTMSEARALMAAACMATDQVMVLGGVTRLQGEPLMAATIEIYDPGSKAWRVFDRPPYGIIRPALFLMPDGSMFTGGNHVTFDPAKRREEGGLPVKLVCE